jgi:hypothetical protein
VRGRKPKELRESSHRGETSRQDVSTDTPPNVKIIIAIREDYLGQLEELSREIPDIFQNRFRLAALTRKQAQDAIEKPAQMQDSQIKTSGFRYAPEAVAAMLDFLCKLKEREQEVMTDVVEPFQLQLLCQDIETKVRQQQKTIVRNEELGGETGMSLVLQNFYDDQINKLGSWQQKHKVRKLCEKGLISATDRRLSLEEEDIARRFHVPKALLAEFVNSHLLPTKLCSSSL